MSLKTAQLDAQYDNIADTSLLELFGKNPERASQYVIDTGNLWFDYSKNRVDDNTIKALVEHAESKNLSSAIKALIGGEEVNNTEKRAAWHSALRNPNDPTADKAISAALNKIEGFVKQLHAHEWQGYTGKPVNAVVNIGIGGSDLGPRMVSQALSAFHAPEIDVHFVGNVDGADLQDTVATLDAETTLFIIASKTFTTLETLSNAESAKQWVLDAGCPEGELHKHFAAVSSNIPKVVEFGMAEENIFPMWDWVGGRYSLWSAIGLPIAIAIGMDNFRSLLAGAHAMDTHFSEAPLDKNMPVIGALLSFWYNQYFGATTHGVLPYAQRLARLPAYLQQLDMESLGKCVNTAGESVNYTTGSVLWGAEGTNGQHSFHQLLHQGTQLIPVDFIAIKQAMSGYEDQHKKLLACCISQSQALLQGKTLQQATAELEAQGLSADEVAFLAPHKVIPGDRPNNTIVMEALNPENLGALIAYYEHKVFTTGVLLDINPFDQWGVELGKQLGTPLYEAFVSGEINENWDGSTKAIMNKLTQ